MKRRVVRTISLLVILMGLLVFTGSAISAAPKQGGILVLGKIGEAPSLDPHFQSAAATRRLLDLVYSKLVFLNEKMEPIPDLAEAWDIPDPQTYIFHLRKGVVFHNGDPLTAEDVKFSLERIIDPTANSWGGAALSVIDKIVVLDKHSIKITLKTPHAGFLALLGSDYACIVSEKVVNEHGHLKDIAVGTGPFKLVKWTPGISTELEKNEEYYKPGLPYLDGIRMQIIPDELSMIAALRTKRIDMGLIQDPRNLRLAEMPEVNITKTPSLNYVYFGLNTNIPPLDDIRVRRAIALAINKEEILRIVGWNLGKLLSPLPPGHQKFALPAEDMPYFKQDLEEAKRLMKEAGYENGFSTEIVSPLPSDWPNLAGAAMMIQADLEKLGIHAEIKQLELASYLYRTDRLKDAPMFTQLNSGRADPDDQLYSVFFSTGPLNRAFLADEKVDYLLNEGRATLDPEKRVAIYKELQVRLAEMVPMVWLYCPDLIDISHQYVKGFIQTPMWSYRYLEQTWLDK